ncbi:TAT-variant-translocated molybdopterin oxidoreductase [Coraliomargarita parva]|uniref:TAT-variant-translocated molybdopterin oxidoreductase n=1 Tax=Coraliomargarita parva TaxID=3014050 RepID=UPI0022B5AC19|nr:TAT-variant-translocated molybdopterin oxidoreductase [Coraliomargarita parva]
MNDPELSGPRYWKSLDDLAETPAFRDWVEREFPAGASELEGVNRRHFMKVMAASFGLAGLGMAGCRRPKQHILPYAQQPENVIPGVPFYYSSSMPGARGNMPVIVETHEGRPTKVEGNPSYKPYGGGTDVYTQASILDLYDPDRATKSRAGSAAISQAAVRDRLAAITAAHTADDGAGLVFLAEPSSSPSRARLVKALQAKFPEATWAEYTAIDGTASVQAATAVFGKPLRGLPKFESAKRVLSLDADFLGADENATGMSRAFTKTRKVKDAKEAEKMSRLYVVESSMSSTGAMADHRLRLSSSQLAAFAAQVGAAVLKAKHAGGGLAGQLDKLGHALDVDHKWVEECAADLVENAGHALVVAGEHLPKSVHAVVAVINAALSAPIDYIEVPAVPAGIAEVAQKLEAGEVKTLITLGGNPAYDAPVDLDWASLQGKAELSVHFGYSYNETSAVSGLFIARSHYLECWGDGRTFDGTLVPVQPMIEPLFQTFNELEVLALLAGADVVDPYEIAVATFKAEGGKDYTKFLSDGLLKDSAAKPAKASIDYAKAATALSVEDFTTGSLGTDNLEVRFAPSSHAYDGRYANNGWLMECPDPMTKLTWDNAILISPRLAKELQEKWGVQIFPDLAKMSKGYAFFKGAKGELQSNKAQFNRGKEEAVVAKLTLNGRTIEAPIHVVPGMANYTVVLPLGMGRKQVGRVGTGVGFDAFAVRSSDGLGIALGAAIELTEKTYRLANTQEHWSMEGRAIVREGNAAYYAEHNDFATKMGVESHAPANYGKNDDQSLQEKSLNNYRGNSAYEHPKFDKAPPNVDVWKGQEDKLPRIQQWGMAIDLNSCTGCTACVVACQSENNIPIVGKDQVLRGREMHWFRLDRYFSAETYNASEVPEDVQVSFMGMLCQHCENAPCESVCPVNATVHDRQGINTMAYNRCVGTRYCANNCPYKVRRFNFFDWNKRKIGDFYKGPFGAVEEPELEKMRANPDVTVRMRGVMEKCTFCVQRIESAKIKQKREAGASNDVHVADGVIRTACQQVCPTDAISFGDISDPESEVSKLKASDRNYSVLGYLNARPRITYLARLRNPNKKMPDYYAKPYAYKAYDERYGHGSGAAHGGEHGDPHAADSHAMESHGAEDAHGDSHEATPSAH